MARRKKNTPGRPATAPAAMPSRRHRHAGLLTALAITVLLAGVPFGLGKYIEFNSPGPFDSAAFVYSAQHLLNGAQLGVDEQPSARPNTLLANVVGVALFGFNDVGPKIVQMLLQLAALGLMFWTVRKIFGPVAAVVSTTLAAIYLSAPLIAKFGNVKEQFMIPFMIAAACCFCLYHNSGKRRWLIVSGFFAVQPYYFKPTGLAIVIAIGLYILISNLRRRNIKTLLLESALFLAGYAVGLAIPASLYLWQHQPAVILKSFPVVAMPLAITLLLAVAAVAGGIAAMKKHGRKLRTLRISKAVWLSGLLLIAVAFLAAVWMIRRQPGYTAGDLGSYMQSIPIVSLVQAPGRLITTQYHAALRAAGLGSGYLTGSRFAIDFADLAPKVGRYYKALSVPILAALAGLLTAAIMRTATVRKADPPAAPALPLRLAGLLGLWWALDMAFVWVSPRSYEQYYLPLCASAAMLSAVACWAWTQKLKTAPVKAPWLIGGSAVLLLLAALTIPIFIGQRYSPDTGADYTQQNRPRRRGFSEALQRVNSQTIQPWQAAGDYIRAHSTEDETLYVWGWVPGIYVRAQRLAPVPKAFESDMHVKPPRQLAAEINGITRRMQARPPRFIVDSRKLHVPWDRPPLELWPHTFDKDLRTGRPLPAQAATMAQYDTLYKQLLAETFDPRQPDNAALGGLTCWLGRVPPPWTKAMPDEARRYDAMEPLRTFVMQHYKIAGHFGDHVLFERQ